MSESDAEAPVDPMADPALSDDPPRANDAVAAAEKMNDPDGPQPGVVADPPAAADDDPLPEPLP